MVKKYPDILVQRVNELYHDLIGEQYDDSHPEIFKRLPKRWKRLAKQFLSNHTQPLTILDLGTGTGFVPLIVSHFLKKEDTFICSDISEKVLEVAKTQITKRNFPNKFKYVKVKAQVPYKLPFRDRSVDVVTVNSMLHHIKETGNFLKEVDRVLKVGGLVFIAHEPNQYFHQNSLLKFQALILRTFLCPRQTITRAARKLGLMPVLEYFYYRFTPPKINNHKICREINRILLTERLIEEPIRVQEIKKITDVQVASGFKPHLILPDYMLLQFQTYNHLSDEIAKKYHGRLVRGYESFLEKIYPTSGNQLFMIKKKE